MSWAGWLFKTWGEFDYAHQQAIKLLFFLEGSQGAMAQFVLWIHYPVWKIIVGVLFTQPFVFLITRKVLLDGKMGASEKKGKDGKD